MRNYLCGDIEFVGDHLGGTTTGATHKERWTDVDIYLTQGGTYVGHVVGRTIIHGETDIHTVHRDEDPVGLIRKMHHKGRLTLPVLQALESAAGYDERLDDALAEFEKPTFIN